jgi:hypothetical protein
LNKAYTRINWENEPSDNTPVNEENLNKMDAAVDELDDRIIILDSTKISIVDASEFFTDIGWDKDTGIITLYRNNGGTAKIDTTLEKLAVNFSYDPTKEQLIITLQDGTIQYVDLSALITQYEFLDSDTIYFALENGKVKAEIKESSIREKHLRPDYLADIKIQQEKATTSANTATSMATNASESAASAENYANQAEVAAKLVVPTFYIDFESGCLMSKTEATGMEFWIQNGEFYGKAV